MASHRSIRNRGKRRKIEVMDLDITSLLDILVILLVFLLKNYNASGVTFNIPKGIELPISQSRNINTSGVIIQVSPTTIWVDDVEILDTKKNRLAYDHGGRRIIPLFNELIKKKNLIKQIGKTTPNAKKFSGIANLVVDKTLKYSFLKKVMYTCADAGFQKYKFVVMSDE